VSEEPTYEEVRTNMETLRHIENIRRYISVFARELINRGDLHDNSKMSDVEFDTFVEYTPKLKNSEYGSEEYKSFLVGMKPALEHHYANNRHHPEHFPNGLEDMNLIDVLEMLIDWKAATLRHETGDILRSIELNKVRFGLSDQLAQIMRNTVELFDRIEPVRIGGEKP